MTCEVLMDVAYGALRRQGFDFFVPWFNGQGGFTMSADGETYTLDVSLCEEALDTDPLTKVQACVPGRPQPTWHTTQKIMKKIP